MLSSLVCVLQCWVAGVAGGALFGLLWALWTWARYRPHLRVPVPDHLRSRALGFESVWALSSFDARLVMEQLFGDDTYFIHDMTVRPATQAKQPIILDVGANTGLFMMQCARRFPHARIHCFEPLPVTFGALALNRESLPPADRDRVTAHNVGVTSFTGPSDAEFTFDPFMSVASTMHPEVMDFHAPTGEKWTTSLVRVLKATLVDFRKVKFIPQRVSEICEMLLGTPVVRELAFVLLLPPVCAVLFTYFGLRNALMKRKVRCSLRSLSSLLSKCIPADAEIEYLKIDVEGAEEDVLRGMSEEDVARVRQMVIEVTDTDGRLERICKWLEEHGFTFTVDKEQWEVLDILRSYNIYAKRKQPDNKPASSK